MCRKSKQDLRRESTVYPTCSDILKSSKQSSEPKPIGLSSLKRGIRELRAVALSFANSLKNVTRGGTGCYMTHSI